MISVGRCASTLPDPDCPCGPDHWRYYLQGGEVMDSREIEPDEAPEGDAPCRYLGLSEAERQAAANELLDRLQEVVSRYEQLRRDLDGNVPGSVRVARQLAHDYERIRRARSYLQFLHSQAVQEEHQHRPTQVSLLYEE